PIREADWWFLTARRVAEPKTPSTASEAPWAFRRVCRCFTAAPRAPSRSLTLLYVVVGADGARAGATPRMASIPAGLCVSARADSAPGKAAAAHRGCQPAIVDHGRAGCPVCAARLGAKHVRSSLPPSPHRIRDRDARARTRILHVRHRISESARPAPVTQGRGGSDRAGDGT